MGAALLPRCCAHLWPCWPCSSIISSRSCMMCWRRADKRGLMATAYGQQGRGRAGGERAGQQLDRGWASSTALTLPTWVGASSTPKEALHAEPAEVAERVQHQTAAAAAAVLQEPGQHLLVGGQSGGVVANRSAAQAHAAGARKVVAARAGSRHGRVGARRTVDARPTARLAWC